MRPALFLAAVLGLSACGGGSDSGPRTPTQPPPAPTQQTWILAGAVVDTITSSPVPSATLTFNGQTLSTSGDGAWQLQGTGVGTNQTVTVSAPGYLARETTIGWSAGGRTGVRLDLIPERAPFTLDFFRQLVRNGFEEPQALRPVRRWTTPPNFYIQAKNPKNGQPLVASEIAAVERAIREAVPQVTGGQYAAGSIEVGQDLPVRRPGYIDVTFVHEPDGDFCADALVGVNPGQIRINYERCPSSCGAFSLETVAHEVGHAMGFWHIGGDGIMNPTRFRDCSNLQFSEDERVHARVAYSRPNGNTDVDRDPSFFAAIQAGPAERIRCRLSLR